jgi:hypothetical protein
VAEVALGVASGEERAQVLEHAASCAECGTLLRDYAGIGDDLLLAAPEHEPPAGFESRVVEGLGVKRLSRSRRPLRFALAAVAVAATTAAVMIFAFGGESRDGVDSAQLREPGGEVAGKVMGYEGSPSWLLVSVGPAYRSGSYRCELVMRSGRRIRLRAFKLDKESGTWGQAIPVNLHDIAEVRVFDGGDEGALRARFES